MEADKLRSWMSDAGLDVWAMIDAAISLAAADLGAYRDGILKRLYSTEVPLEGQHSKCRSAAVAVETISTPPQPAIQKEEKVENQPSPKEDQKQQIKPLNDPMRLAWATKRLRENYPKAERAKKSRVTDVTEIHQIPIKRSKCGSTTVEPISRPPPATQKEEKVENQSPPKQDHKQQATPLDDPVRLTLARKRLRENYLESERAKKSRVPVLLGFHQIPIMPNVSVVRKTSFRGKRH